jgi:hypothetical protein
MQKNDLSVYSLVLFFWGGECKKLKKCGKMKLGNFWHSSLGVVMRAIG